MVEDGRRPDLHPERLEALELRLAARLVKFDLGPADGARLPQLGDGRDESGRERACRPDLARALVERMATYGLGRTLGLEDEAALTSLTGEFLADDLRLRGLVESLAASAMFRTK